MRRRQACDREPCQLLLAEDDADLRALVADAFQRRSTQVTEYVDGPDLVSKLGSHLLFSPSAGFDFTTSDIRMPDATALEVLEAMRECEGVPPVILMTALPSEQTHTAPRQLLVAADVGRPFEIDDLVAKAGPLLAERLGDAP